MQPCYAQALQRWAALQAQHNEAGSWSPEHTLSAVTDAMWLLHDLHHQQLAQQLLLDEEVEQQQQAIEVCSGPTVYFCACRTALRLRIAPCSRQGICSTDVSLHCGRQQNPRLQMC